MSKKNDIGGFVYSTNPNFKPTQTTEEVSTPGNSAQLLQLHRETKGRGGKAVVIVKGYVGKDSDLESLGKQLKSHCGTGGSVKDGEILIQGDQREKVAAFLKSKGYRIKYVGG